MPCFYLAAYPTNLTHAVLWLIYRWAAVSAKFHFLARGDTQWHSELRNETATWALA
jgi:hypothetical protein|eukprot:COSAG01_NODE_6180_length_3806_cov_35.350958_4_plen_56_part_00